MTSLTDRYVAQVVRHLPEAARPDIARELTALIADMVEERTAAAPDTVSPGATVPGTASHGTASHGTASSDAASSDTVSPDDDGGENRAAAVRRAEREALTELGDPAILALQYSDRPRYLIGPELFPAFARVLRFVLPWVLVAAAMINAVVYTATTPEPHLGGMIGAVVGRVVVALLAAAGALTVLFAVVEWVLSADERSRVARAGQRAWSVDDLAETADPRPHRDDAIASLVMIAFFALLPIVPSTFFYAGHLNDGRPFIDQGLWAGWLPAFYVLLVLLAAVSVALLVRRRWTTPLLVTAIALDVALAALLSAAVLTQQVLDPALAAAAGWTAPAWLAPLVVATIWLITAWDQLETVRTWRRERAEQREPAAAGSGR